MGLSVGLNSSINSKTLFTGILASTSPISGVCGGGISVCSISGVSEGVATVVCASEGMFGVWDGGLLQETNSSVSATQQYNKLRTGI